MASPAASDHLHEADEDISDFEALNCQDSDSGASTIDGIPHYPDEQRQESESEAGDASHGQVEESRRYQGGASTNRSPPPQGMLGFFQCLEKMPLEVREEMIEELTRTLAVDKAAADIRSRLSEYFPEISNAVVAMDVLPPGGDITDPLMHRADLQSSVLYNLKTIPTKWLKILTQQWARRFCGGRWGREGCILIDVSYGENLEKVGYLRCSEGGDDVFWDEVYCDGGLKEIFRDVLTDLLLAQGMKVDEPLDIVSSSSEPVEDGSSERWGRSWANSALDRFLTPWFPEGLLDSMIFEPMIEEEKSIKLSVRDVIMMEFSEDPSSSDGDDELADRSGDVEVDMLDPGIT